MKIGILTLPLHTNYGGILQAYALQTVLEQMGHEVVVLDKDRDICRSFLRQIPTFFKYIVQKYMLGKNVRYYKPERENKERLEREQYTNTFIKRYIHTRTVKDISPGIFNDMDVVVVGSDQVWRPLYFKGQWESEMYNAFLEFEEHFDVKKIAYAASFGTDDWEYSEKETKKCASLLQKFDAVSVRESSAIQLCMNKLGRNDVRHVLDPTMLLNKEDYIRLVKTNKTSKSLGNLMCYILDSSIKKEKLIKQIAIDRDLTPFRMGVQTQNPALPNSERIQPPLEQWLRGFIDAKLVVTDSFHACVFSIIFGKPFLVIGNEKRGLARFNSLLSMFSLNSNIIADINEYQPNYSYSIHEDAMKWLADYKAQSFEFLHESLK